MEDEAKALQHSVADATAEVKRCEEELALLPETADAFACAAVGCPVGSRRCWTLSNDAIAAGEEGTVVGVLHGQGKVEVKFRKVTWFLDPGQLITAEEKARQDAEAEREAARRANPEAAVRCPLPVIAVCFLYLSYNLILY